MSVSTWQLLGSRENLIWMLASVNHGQRHEKWTGTCRVFRPGNYLTQLNDPAPLGVLSYRIGRLTAPSERLSALSSYI